jgi:outer membrane protein TolC
LGFRQPHRQRECKEKSLEITQKLYDDNRKRAAIGAVAPIDIIQAEAGVETSQLDLRQARTQMVQQELIMKSVFDPHRC